MYFETEMYHAAAKSFVCARLATVREHAPAIARVQLNLQVPSAQRVAQHGYPPGDLLLPFGQFTLCCACVEQTACVAVKYLALRIGREMGAHCAPLRKKKILCRSPIVSVLQISPCYLKRKRDSKGWKPWCPSFCPPPWVRRTPALRRAQLSA